VTKFDPAFKDVDCNLYMGLVAYGVNPFGNQSSKYSMWPILILLNNLLS
jgi:hypothetical protein